MDKIKNMPIKRSMAAAFMITICMIGVLSGITVFLSNRSQKEILKNRYLTVKQPNLKLDKDKYILDIDENNMELHELSLGENIAYYGCYAAMLCLPVLYLTAGIGGAAAVYYRVKLKTPILQLQNGMQKIQENDLDFSIGYRADDELGKLCGSMEKMRGELRRNQKALWEMLKQRKLLNASVAHDLRTPVTVLRGYLDYLEKNIPKDKLTEEALMETIASMQGAVLRLERYTECVRDVEKLEGIEIKRERQDAAALLKEMESNICQLENDGKIIFRADISLQEANIDKSALFRILENLLQNAMRYRKEQIIVEVFKKNNLFLLSVKDDGRGFSEEALMQAVNMFYSEEKGSAGGYQYAGGRADSGNPKGCQYAKGQADSGNPRGCQYAQGRAESGNEHFGIGLGICRLLCEKHGGFLQISNCENSGACVTAALDIG